MSMLIDTINESRLVNPTLAEVRAVANKADNTNLALSVREALKSTFGDRMFKTVIRRSVRVGEAQTANLPITKYRPNDPAAADYMKLAKEVRESGKTDI
jgi:chromosome partitioning protein